MGVRRQSRENALQVIYMCDFMNQWSAEQVYQTFTHFDVPKHIRVYADGLALGVIENRAVIDSKLTSASEHWSISRMGRVDRALLRVGAYEILFVPDIPHSVAINEAIEIAKRFGSDESPNFINGVLDKLAALHPKQLVANHNGPLLVEKIVVGQELDSERLELGAEFDGDSNGLRTGSDR